MAARQSPRSKPDQSFASITVLEPQAERRRRQLVEIAARLVEREGVDAVRIPLVAELAGVGRTAIYRYFPRREDLLVAVSADFDERLRERIEPGEFVAGLLALREETGGEMPGSTSRLFEAIWDVLDERGPAGLILRAHSAAHADEDRTPDLVDRFRAQWIAVGLPALESTLISDTANAILTRLYTSVRRGEIDRKAAIQLGYRTLVALVRGLSQTRMP
jgi:AcrR family transcriptional regulator